MYALSCSVSDFSCHKHIIHTLWTECLSNENLERDFGVYNDPQVQSELNLLKSIMYTNISAHFTLLYIKTYSLIKYFAQLAGAVEYTNCFSAEG